MTAKTALALVLLTPTIAAAQARPWQARLRLALVSPDDSSSTNPGSGARLGVDGSDGVGVSLSYALASDWAVELSWLNTKLETSASATDWPTTNIGEVGIDVAAATVQYHPLTRGRCRPYVGAGAHIALFSRHASRRALAEAGIGSVSLDDHASLSAQLGADFDVGERFTVNVDVTYHDVATDVLLRLTNGQPFATVRLDVDPWVYSIGGGIRF